MSIFGASEVAMLLATIFILLLCYYKWAFLYWHRAKIPFLYPQLLFGNCYSAITGKENWAVTMKNLYHEIKGNGWKHAGIYVFTSPNYLPVDLEYLRSILGNDFHHFTDRGGYFNRKGPMGGNLVGTGGTHWRNLRPKLTPAFTTSKMRTIFNNMGQFQENLLKKVEEESKNGPFEMKKICGSFTLDIIGYYIFGLNLHSLEEETTEFKKYTKKVTHKSVLDRLVLSFAANFPTVGAKLNIKSYPKEVTDFFTKTVEDIVELKKITKKHQNDFLQFLLELKNTDFEDVIAQSFIFVIAGFETGAIAMTLALYELARNPNVQEKVRREIAIVLGKHEGKINYDSMKEMKYLGQVVDETLRMYPPLPMINRKCVKDYRIPGEDVVIKEGTIVIIPIMGVHYDEEFYPDPEKFDPERFSEENKNSRPKLAYMPFGVGPRTCIGLQFALTMVKMGLCCLLKNFVFAVDAKTSNPLRIEPNNLSLAIEGGIWLKATKIQENEVVAASARDNNIQISSVK